MACPEGECVHRDLPVSCQCIHHGSVTPPPGAERMRFMDRPQPGLGGCQRCPLFRPIIPVILRNRSCMIQDPLVTMRSSGCQDTTQIVREMGFLGDLYRAGVGSQIYTMGSVLMFSLEARRHGAGNRGQKRLESFAMNR